MEHVAGPVDDGLEQLVPGPRGRRESGDLVKEAQLFELVGGAPRAASDGRPGADARSARGCGTDGRHGHHHTSLRKVATRKVAARWRLGRGTVQADDPETPPARSRASAAVAAEPLGIGTAGARDPLAGRGPAARGTARAGHRGTGRPRAVRLGRADPASHDRAAPGRRPGRADTARRGRCAPSTSAPPRPSSARSPSTSGSSTWPRRAAGCAPCGAASGRLRDGILDDSVADAVAGLRRLGRRGCRAG